MGRPSLWRSWGRGRAFSRRVSAMTAGWSTIRPRGQGCCHRFANRPSIARRSGKSSSTTTLQSSSGHSSQARRTAPKSSPRACVNASSVRRGCSPFERRAPELAARSPARGLYRKGVVASGHARTFRDSLLRLAGSLSPTRGTVGYTLEPVMEPWWSHVLQAHRWTMPERLLTGAIWKPGRPCGRPSGSQSAGVRGFCKPARLVGLDSGGGIRTRDLRVMSPTRQ